MTRPTLQSLCRALAEADPEGLVALGAPDDEYLPEAEALLGLEHLDADVVRGVFQGFFGPVATTHPDRFWELLAARCEASQID
ncbi:hypothetical protein [Phycicoccus avicenniae]|uniref:hypothetical protein n=1 Tax=Phycicoccus avicenniae TaxID=2828860 RepID=UPI003D269A42